MIETYQDGYDACVRLKNGNGSIPPFPQKEEEEEVEQKKVRVIGFRPTEHHNDKVKHPLPKSLLFPICFQSANGEILAIKELPEELADDLWKNGWLDEHNLICFPQTYQPSPVKGKDGHVYLVLNETLLEERGHGLMKESREMQGSWSMDTDYRHLIPYYFSFHKWIGFYDDDDTEGKT